MQDNITHLDQRTIRSGLALVSLRGTWEETIPDVVVDSMPKVAMYDPKSEPSRSTSGTNPPTPERGSSQPFAASLKDALSWLQQQR